MGVGWLTSHDIMSQAVDDVAESMILLPPLVSAAKGAASMRCFFFLGGRFLYGQAIFWSPLFGSPFFVWGGGWGGFYDFSEYFCANFFLYPPQSDKEMLATKPFDGKLV